MATVGHHRSIRDNDRVYMLRLRRRLNSFSVSAWPKALPARRGEAGEVVPVELGSAIKEDGVPPGAPVHSWVPRAVLLLGDSCLARFAAGDDGIAAHCLYRENKKKREMLGAESANPYPELVAGRRPEVSG